VLAACQALARWVRGLGFDVRGGTAVIFALATPALALLGCGAIDLASVNADHSAMQDTADATALAMAKQLGVATAAGIASRAEAFADQQLGPIVQNDAVSVTTTIAADNGSVTVVVSGHRSSFFGNLLPPGGWTLSAQATAATLGQLPLCVLSSGAAAGSNVQLTGSSQMTAASCLVQSNADISVDNGSALNAGLAQAVGTANGPITPAAQTGAPAISDPFASMNITPPLLGLCNPLDVVYDVGVNLLTPGTHCGNLTVKNGATVQLLPGEYYFTKGQLIMQDNSTLTGSNVVLVFDSTSSFSFQDSSTITLTGRATGAYAGFVIATTRDNTNAFTISSTSARQLEGTIYIPSSTLAITGNSNTVAAQSAWTVVVAQAIQMSGSPNLVINANYAASQVPVPAGVGANHTGGGSVELTR
jgi:Flp pilus assembly protein TadG